ncbi:glutamate racemase [Caldibacillus thermolactis]|uniref:Glutamate racemase n=1 Tax=Pallidibacillus thermolactis TaxID=251051 RepID=A0ABT2WG35_9BACI|nr:glutamate racemase [Pallidibacillus thermolactis]MCU9594655.1 glutamate racemase [Pallidibacillus thermolactis]MCU9602794.1 glutamate racemase [Pallidibacillus thermolactis subsp. kokeshiiformis]
MASNPIGIIDSGVGGLTVVKEMMRQLPNESIIYMGDTARCPYGPRTSEEIRQFTWEMTRYLEQFHIKMLIIACNTATAVALEEIRESLNIPVLGVIHPGARAAISVSKKYKIGVIGTDMTIRSKAYEHALKTIHNEVDVYGLACPKLVPLVESGVIHGDLAEKIVANSLYPLQDKHIDTLILGCTHYPIIQPLIENYYNHKVKVISSGEETAREASAILDHTHMLNMSKDQPPIYKFFTTGSKTIFQSIAKQWLRMDDLEVETVKLSNVEYI